MKTSEDRYCRYCGLQFTPRTANQIYHNSRCYQLAVHPPKQPLQPRACVWCHSMYMPNKYYSESAATFQKFCGCTCRDSYHAMRQRIFNKYFFEGAKMHEQLDKLEKEGCNYALS